MVSSAVIDQQPKLGNRNDWEISVNDHRVVLRYRKKASGVDVVDITDGNTSGTDNWTIISSAVLNGGVHQTTCTGASGLQLLNTKVPADYDGVTPNPVKLMEEMAQREQSELSTDDSTTPVKSIKHVTTIGMMTAASMESLRICTQQAVIKQPTSQSQLKQHVIVDAIVTAGISNSRAAGAAADCFLFSSPEAEAGGEATASHAAPPPGTVNTIIVTNAIMDESDCNSDSCGSNSSIMVGSMVEAYAIAIEAKCRAATDLGVRCAKRPDQWAQGTGTDSTMFVCRRGTNSSTKQDATPGSITYPRVQYAGKHTLFGELVGQAVYQATREAILSNIEYMHGKKHRRFGLFLPLPPLWLYRIHGYKLQLLHALRHGHRPWVPSQPMNPVPKPQGLVLLVGIIGVLMAFWLHLQWGSFRHINYSQHAAIADSTIMEIQHASRDYLRPSISVLVAVLSWDRFLGGSLFVPISLHPVVLTGNTITAILKHMPGSVFQHQHAFRGVVAGCSLFLGTVTVSLSVAWCLLMVPRIVLISADTSNPIRLLLSKFLPWIFELYLVQSALSLQLLCTIALQMAHFLERGQLDEARNQLSWLCSRDPSSLVSDELAGGTLESLSENLSDSLVSPLTYYVLFGPLGAFGFRVINTLDSRVGYRGGRYEFVGKPSARIDDLLNLFSARLTALLLALAAWCLDPRSHSGGRCSVNQDENSRSSICAKRGLQTALRDAGQCDSPNAGWPMAAMAGILGVCLEKKGQYALNKAGPPPGHRTIRIGHDIAQLAGLLAVLLAMTVSTLLRGATGATSPSFRW